ncbi:hypothetical protein L226DRAFT_227886 [Lentinus tigrinus ALCF2SS1-7]|uniref:Uncharacterized protein n=1 Tax=Lentinus tigrinus ALCF2SS1-6 TaxID=1328759 RepID=A0A5C2S2Z0_9APHY|nr:hypothetical protein L227DRAFT_201881 [Lentinus tigrinus ALCF2SS1-6]RPD70424.1 hypothetical protein L226DRAFT_227886 [Lentinus tigrinus ALCF2SS1-7]
MMSVPASLYMCTYNRGAAMLTASNIQIPCTIHETRSTKHEARSTAARSTAPVAMELDRSTTGRLKASDANRHIPNAKRQLSDPRSCVLLYICFNAPRLDSPLFRPRSCQCSVSVTVTLSRCPRCQYQSVIMIHDGRTALGHSVPDLGGKPTRRACGVSSAGLIPVLASRQAAEA